jgi:hypothetical protein
MKYFLLIIYMINNEILIIRLNSNGLYPKRIYAIRRSEINEMNKKNIFQIIYNFFFLKLNKFFF